MSIIVKFTKKYTQFLFFDKFTYLFFDKSYHTKYYNPK